MSVEKEGEAKGTTAGFNTTLTADQLAALAKFRGALRRFLAFSEAVDRRHGLTPQQYQALLAIKAHHSGQISVGHLAQKMLLKHHSAVQLVDRLVTSGLVQRVASENDRRVVCIRLTGLGARKLGRLAAVHFREIATYREELAALARMAANLDGKSGTRLR